MNNHKISDASDIKHLWSLARKVQLYTVATLTGRHVIDSDDDLTEILEQLLCEELFREWSYL